MSCVLTAQHALDASQHSSKHYSNCLTPAHYLNPAAVKLDLARSLQKYHKLHLCDASHLTDQSEHVGACNSGPSSRLLAAYCKKCSTRHGVTIDASVLFVQDAHLHAVEFPVLPGDRHCTA